MGSLDTVVGPVPVVSALLSPADHWGSFKVRLDFGRMDYEVDPGLYAVGVPDAGAPVLVTANYKLSFDSLRRHLVGRDVWLLVLDTKGVNVWCAAGKGTFSTEELVTRLNDCGLSRLVEHRQVILPQLAGPGVAAHLIPKATGFSVRYGPVLAADLPQYLDDDGHIPAAMRVKDFPFLERLVFAPLELLLALKGSLPFFIMLALLFGFLPGEGYLQNIITQALSASYPYFAGVIAGTVLTPLLLTWLPGRAFAVKGAAAGLIVSSWLLVYPLPLLQGIASLLIMMVLSSYWGMKFTGASTYTSLSGVKKEMRIAVPMQIVGGVIGLGCWVVASFI
ncbi:MAG: mercury methylation corrinoid protein HgcA [Desulfobulbaceae bacterium]|nr:mercury methylation corrinoid protein HgcA [Desulfobulbaceae bacterium]